MPLETDWKAAQQSRKADFKDFSEHLQEVHFDWKIKQATGLNKSTNAYIKKYSLGDCFLTDILALPMKGQRDLSQNTADTSCYLAISYIIDGKGYKISIPGDKVFVMRGNVFLWNTNQLMQFESAENIRQLSLLLPGAYNDTVQSLLVPDKIIVLDDNDVLSNLLRSTLLTLRKNAHKIRTSDERVIIGTVLGLVKSCTEIRSATQIVKNKNQNHFFKEAQEYIEENLFDADLSVSSISRVLGISTRYVYKLFAERNISLAKTISNRRTEQAALYLADTGLTELSITDIAFMVGFNDSAYFSRVFKEKYGVSPREYRLRNKQPVNDRNSV